MNEKRKVFVSGCFDLIHSGHIAFLKNAAEFGELFVSVGSDKILRELKGKNPVYNENERLFIIRNLSCVKGAFIGTGNGFLDFLPEMEKIKPDVFVVNDDGDRQEKRELCKRLGVEYVVLKRKPHDNLPGRSSTILREKNNIPYRIDIAGGWIDQPFVSKLYPGAVINLAIEPDYEFNLRSGMASSTRNKAIKLWGNRIIGTDEETAKILFGADNPPGTKEIAGSQDSIGIIIPGLKYIYYNGEYWPERIEITKDKEILDWIESVIQLVPLSPRINDYNVFDESYITIENAKKLSEAAENCYRAILNRNTEDFGKYLKESFEAQIAIFPKMINKEVIEKINEIKNSAKGWKISGAGGGGYLIAVSDKPIENSIKIKIRR